MNLIVGLGNPGKDYQNTRHNVGFMVVDELQKLKLPKDVILKKSDQFMNESGKCIDVLIHRYKAKMSDLYVIHDDLDIKLGEYKVQFGRGPKDHNGLKSIDESLGTNEYWHVRVGIDNRPLDNKPMGEEYVLQNFTDEEREVLNRTIKKVASSFLSSR